MTKNKAFELFDHNFETLLALVERRLKTELRYHNLEPLKQSQKDLLDYAALLGETLKVVYQHRIYSALDEEVKWYGELFLARGWKQEALMMILDSWIIAIEGIIKPPESRMLSGAIRQLRDHLEKHPIDQMEKTVPAPSEEILRFAEMLVEGEFQAAWNLLAQLVSAGTLPYRLVEDFIVPALQTIGLHWQGGQVEVFQEHLATQTAQRLLNTLLFQFPPQEDLPFKALICGVPGEQHALVHEALNTYLQLRGWRTICLGSNLPISQILKAVHHFKPQVLFLSLVLVGRLGAAVELIDIVRESNPDMLLVFGGRGALMTREYLAKYPVLLASSFREGHDLAGAELKRRLG
ncbi:hypothetical protein D6779_11310 [Candidatus Parcubacteria bacterium]|nr:MAG: hypothetical protein D6779_11310 [Candidatus Parcubacteria bacterium]